MAGLPWTSAENEMLKERYEAGAPVDELRKLFPHRGYHAVRNHARVMGWKWASSVKRDTAFVESPLPVRAPLPELLKDHAERFRRKEAHHRSKREGLDIVLPGDGPYALMAFGDVHADDDGTDLEYLAYCCEVAKDTPHTWAFHVGDMTNNWIGNLARLYEHQGASGDEGKVLLEWILDAAPWLFVIGGNHDKWGPRLEDACVAKGIVCVSHGARWFIRRGADQVIVDAAHDHQGRSQYAAEFAQRKKSFRGSPADIIVGGHTHQSGYGMSKNGETGVVGHCLRLSSFKRYDEYADAKGFSDGAISPCVLCLIDPRRGPEGRVTVFHDIDLGVLCLKAVREEYEKESVD